MPDAAKKGDKVKALDSHFVIFPNMAPVLLPHEFSGVIDGDLSSDVKIDGEFAAIEGSTATNTPGHIPVGGGTFQKPPSDKAKIIIGSQTVKINGKGAARQFDKAETCNDPADLPIGNVMASSTVKIGG